MINQLFVDCIQYLLNSIIICTFPLDATYSGLFIEDQKANVLHRIIQSYQPGIF